MMRSMLALLVSAACAGPAMANSSYTTICNSCSPFNKTSPAVLTAATNLGATSGAVVGDWLNVCHDTQTGYSTTITYEVTHAPVTTSSDFVWIYTFGVDNLCNE